jgi:hypothetical protein
MIRWNIMLFESISCTNIGTCALSGKVSKGHFENAEMLAVSTFRLRAAFDS